MRRFSSKIVVSIFSTCMVLSGCQKPQESDNKIDEPDISTSQQESNITQAPSSTSSSQMDAQRTFDYVPKQPQDGKIMGVGAVGSSELTSLVVDIDKNKNWKLIDRKDDNSLLEEGISDESEIQKRLESYLSGMHEEGVDSRNMHFIISSGAAQSGNAEPLIKALKSSGYIVNIITPEAEAKYAFKATVPHEYRVNSFMVDIGSGNTKISWEEDGKLKAVETYGAKYFQKDISPNTVYEEVKSLIETIPVTNRENCFIIGGVPYSLAKPIRKDKERYVVLNNPETYTPEDEKQMAGLNIYNAMVQTTGLDSKFIFDFDSHYAIGFLEGL